MADPFSIASGVAGLLGLVLTLADTSYQYVLSAKNAPKSINAYIQELSALRGVLFKLHELTLELKTSNVFNAAQTSLLSIMSIEQCQQDLNRKITKTCGEESSAFPNLAILR